MGGKLSPFLRALDHTDATILQPYFNEALGAGKSKLATLFIPKCTSLTPTERIEMWLKCGMVAKAADEAFKAKDRMALEELRAQANGQDAVEVERLVGLMNKGR